MIEAEELQQGSSNRDLLCRIWLQPEGMREDGKGATLDSKLWTISKLSTTCNAMELDVCKSSVCLLITTSLVNWYKTNSLVYVLICTAYNFPYLYDEIIQKISYSWQITRSCCLRTALSLFSTLNFGILTIAFLVKWKPWIVTWVAFCPVEVAIKRTLCFAWVNQKIGLSLLCTE